MADPSDTAVTVSSTEERLSLEQLRHEIDRVDDTIHDLLLARAELVWQVGELKGRKADVHFYRPEREAQIHRRLEQRHRGRLPMAALHRIFREIISASLSLEKQITIAYLGPEAAFTHQAALKHFGSSFTLVAARTIDELFREVECGRAEYGITPVENSVEGVVNHTLDRLVDSPLLICAETLLPVVHNLLSREVALTPVHTVYGHFQAMEQCRLWLDRHLPQGVLHEVESTGQAIRLAREEPGTAAIAGVYAADDTGLNILAEHIEDQADMENRFLVIGRQEPAPSGRDQTSLLFTLRDQPGCLHRALGLFADREINLKRIESRPSKRKTWEYHFFISCEGHSRDERIIAALQDLSEIPGLSFRLLGSYPQPAL